MVSTYNQIVINKLAFFETVPSRFRIRSLAGEGEGGVDHILELFPGLDRRGPVRVGDLSDVKKAFHRRAAGIIVIAAVAVNGPAVEHIAVAAGHAEHDADMAWEAESLTCDLTGDDVAGYRAGRPLASAVVDGIIPALILRAESTVHDAIRCTVRRNVCLAVLVQNGLEKAALRVVFHNVQTLRKARIIEINFDLSHHCPPCSK